MEERTKKIDLDDNVNTANVLFHSYRNKIDYLHIRYTIKYL
jgi:hypothetical protein